MKLLSWISVILFTISIVSCTSYGEKFSMDNTEFYFSGISKDEASKIANYIAEAGWTDSIPKSILLKQVNDTLEFRFVVLDKLRSDFDLERHIAGMAFNYSIEFGKPAAGSVCDNHFNSLKRFPSKVLSSDPTIFSDSSVTSKEVAQVAISLRNDSLLPNQEFVYIKKAGPTYQIGLAFESPESIDSDIIQKLSTRLRREVFNENQTNVYISDKFLRKHKVLFGL